MHLVGVILSKLKAIRRRIQPDKACKSVALTDGPNKIGSNNCRKHEKSLSRNRCLGEGKFTFTKRYLFDIEPSLECSIFQREGVRRLTRPKKVENSRTVENHQIDAGLEALGCVQLRSFYGCFYICEIW